MGYIVYIILVLYIGFTFIGSLTGIKPKDSTPESYFMANRNLTTLSLFFTILATNFSAFYFLGFSGESYRIGYSYYTIMAFGTSLASITIFYLGKQVWKLGKEHQFITPGELIYHSSGSLALRYLYSGVMVIFTLPYLALQIIGGGYILENLTNGGIPYLLAIFLLTVFTILYVLIGGMQSVVKTDLKQGLMAIIFMFLAFILISNSLGGFTLANANLLEMQPGLFEIEGKNLHYTPQKWFSFLIFWMFCIPMFPQLFMRFFIAKDLNHFKKSAFLYGAIPLIISFFPVAIGVFGHLSFPGLEGKAADQILPMMLVEHTSEWFAALIMTGAIAAFMSTLDSQLLALSTIITRDFYIPISGKKLDFQKEVLTGRILVAIFAIIGLLIAMNPFATIFDMGKMSFAGLAILFPTSVAYLNWGGTSSKMAIASILIGEFLLMAFYYGILPKSLLLGFESFIPILVLCFILVIIKRK